MAGRKYTGDYYKRLGIDLTKPDPKDATKRVERPLDEISHDEIRKAYVKIRTKNQPEEIRADATVKGLNEETIQKLIKEGDGRIKAAGEAWDELRNTDKRAEYDVYHSKLFGSKISASDVEAAAKKKAADAAAHAREEELRARTAEARERAQARARADAEEAARRRAQENARRAEEAAQRARTNAGGAGSSDFGSMGDAFTRRAERTDKASKEKGEAIFSRLNAWKNGLFKAKEKTPRFETVYRGAEEKPSFFEKVFKTENGKLHGGKVTAAVLGGLAVAAVAENSLNKPLNSPALTDSKWQDALAQQAIAQQAGPSL